MKINSFILAFVFLFGGNGLSMNIAQCCSQFTGIGISFNSHEHQEEKKDCCFCIKAIKKKKCCDDLVIQTVINSVLGLEKLSNFNTKQFSFNIFLHKGQEQLVFSKIVQITSGNDDSYYHDPVPVLIKKRLLQI